MKQHGQQVVILTGELLPVDDPSLFHLAMFFSITHGEDFVDDLIELKISFSKIFRPPKTGGRLWKE